jgi:hypothetical protein
MLYRVDITGSLILDTTPRFCPPLDIIGKIETFELPNSLYSTLRYWNLMFPTLTDISAALSSLSRLAIYTNENDSKSGTERDDMFLAYRIYPVAHQLLSLLRHPEHRKQTQCTQGIKIREVLRLAAIVLIELLKKQYGTYPDGIAQSMKKASCLLRNSIDWSDFRALQLWVFVVFALADDSCGSEKMWYVSNIARTMKDMNLCYWDQVLDVLRDLIWIEVIMAHGCEALKVDIEMFQYTIRQQNSLKVIKN